MKNSDPATALGILLSADESSLERLRDILDALLATKRKLPVEKPPRITSPKVVIDPPKTGMGPSISGRSGLNVGPMRPPRPGSVRADVHRVLAMRGEASRGEIIADVVRLRGGHQPPNFSTKVGDALTRLNDPRIHKVARGVFRYIPE